MKRLGRAILGNKAMTGFRDFILRGNVVDLAIGVVIGAAFATLVGAFGKAFLTPLIALVAGNKKGQGDLGAHFTIHGQHFLYGDFITAIFVFAITAAVVYFAVVQPVNRLMARFGKGPAPVKHCPECLSAIPVPATRCAFCAVVQPS